MTSCANPTCDKPLPARAHTGRPAIYCSPACRQRRHRSRPDRPADTAPVNGTGAATADTIVVELDHPDHSPDGRPIERVWTLRLRRDRHVVIIAEGLGWPTANALARQLQDLLAPAPPPQATATRQVRP